MFKKQIVELFLNCFKIRFLISFPIFFFLPAPPPLPPLSLPPSLLLFLHFSSYSRHCQFLSSSPFTFTLFSIFLFSLLLLLPLCIILELLCPSTHSFPLFNQYTYPNFLFLHFFSFLSTSPTIANLLSFKLISGEVAEYRDAWIILHTEIRKLLNFWGKSLSDSDPRAPPHL